MKLTLPKTDLLNILGAAAGAITGKTSLPILSHIAVRVDKDGLSLTGTDLDLTIRASLAVQSKGTGAFCVQGHKLHQVVRELPDGEITIEAQDRAGKGKDGDEDIAKLVLDSGAVTFKLPTMPWEEFPPFPTVGRKKGDSVEKDGPITFTMPQKQLKQLFKLTVFAASVDASRYVLNGVHFDMKQNAVALVATDGRRISVAEAKLDFTVTPGHSIIVPTRTVMQLSKLLGDEGDVEVKMDESKAQFTIGDVLVVSRLIEGSYPNYNRVMPEGGKDAAAIDCGGLVDALHRVRLISESGKFEFAKNNLTITSHGKPDEGYACEGLLCGNEGKLTALFSLDYLLGGLEAALASGVTSIHWHKGDKTTPVLLTTDDCAGWRYAVMPMRLEEEKPVESKPVSEPVSEEKKPEPKAEKKGKEAAA